MTFEKAREAIVNMLNVLYEKDNFLLQKKLNITERSITHRMGMYLQQVIPEWDVDCEYNRMGKASNGHVAYTDGDYFAKTVCLTEGLVNDDDDIGSRVFPDIIVHKRGSASNLIIIEVKVQWKSNKSSRDIKKLHAYKNDLNYKYAFYIELTEQRKDVKIEVAFA